MLDINKIVPQGDRCLVQPYEAAKQTASGLQLAEAENTPTPVMGVIRRAGVKSAYKNGTHILFRRYGIDELKLQQGAEDVFVYVISDEEVVAVIEQ